MGIPVELYVLTPIANNKALRLKMTEWSLPMDWLGSDRVSRTQIENGACGTELISLVVK